MNVQISYGNLSTGEWELVATIEFPEISLDWLTAGRLPTKDESMPKRPFTLPTGEEFILGVCRFPEENQTNIWVFTSERNILSVIAKGHLDIIFESPERATVCIAVHDFKIMPE